MQDASELGKQKDMCLSFSEVSELTGTTPSNLRFFEFTWLLTFLSFMGFFSDILFLCLSLNSSNLRLHRLHAFNISCQLSRIFLCFETIFLI